MRDAGRAVEIWERTVWLRSPLLLVNQVLKYQANDANLMDWACVGLCAWSSPIFPGSIECANGSLLLLMETQFNRFTQRVKALGSGGKCQRWETLVLDPSMPLPHRQLGQGIPLPDFAPHLSMGSNFLF